MVKRMRNLVLNTKILNLVKPRPCKGFGELKKTMSKFMKQGSLEILSKLSEVTESFSWQTDKKVCY